MRLECGRHAIRACRLARAPGRSSMARSRGAGEGASLMAHSMLERVRHAAARPMDDRRLDGIRDHKDEKAKLYNEFAIHVRRCQHF